MKRKTQKQSGFVYTLEIIFIATCVMCMLVIGWAAIGAKVVAEMSDIGSAVGSLDQTYRTSGMLVGHNGTTHPATPQGALAYWAGSGFNDNADFCDQGCDCGVVMCIPPQEPEFHQQ
jgi:hypothetical protein